MEKNEIFNREALNKLRSPEKLDTMFAITTPVSWIGLAAIGILLFSILLWSIFGAFTVKADGMGLIMDSAGVVNVSHTATGKISEVYVKKGSIVKRGDLIAKLEQADRSADTRMAQYGMGLAANDREAMERVYQYDAKRQQQTVAENIYSDYNGIVDDVLVEKGTILRKDAPVCTIRLTQDRDDLIGILYVPVDKGKRIEPGMTMQLAPHGVDVSESGSLMGVVRSISQYPVSA
ncbi:MAG: biotin/lipoyl-binding protein, partial [Selenomonadaceae bacterium]|nr:biotin/lipoyl-binding protein [Selenomonadaceae bacterium]